MAVKQKNNLMKILLFSALWLLVWSVTHGFFMSPGLMQLIPAALNIQYLLASVYILFVVAGSVAYFPKAKVDLPKSKLLYLYSIPLFLLIILPYHYQLELNVYVYMFMVVVTCFWQDYLTFGLYQSAVSKVATQRMTIVVVASLFTIGHVLFFLNKFTVESTLGWLGILASALVFATIKIKTRNMYLINILHLSFLLLFA